MRKLFAAAALAVVTIASPAAATTVTFDATATTAGGTTGDGITYEEAGLTFTSSRAETDALYHWGTSDLPNADDDGATLLQNYIGEFLIVTRTGGGSFFLKSIDLADGYDNSTAGDVNFSYTDGGGLHSTVLTLDGAYGLQTFNLNLAGVSSFSLQQSGPYFQLDNVVYDVGAGNVPEPGTWALMILGFGGAGAMLRRRRAALA